MSAQSSSAVPAIGPPPDWNVRRILIVAHGKHNTLHSREVQALFPSKGVVGCRIFRVDLLDHETGLPNDPGGRRITCSRARNTGTTLPARTQS